MLGCLGLLLLPGRHQIQPPSVVLMLQGCQLGSPALQLEVPAGRAPGMGSVWAALAADGMARKTSQSQLPALT